MFYVGFTILKEHGKIFAKTLPYPSKNQYEYENINHRRLWTNRELTHSLRKIYGADNVIASDIRKLNNDVVNSGKFEVINALDFNQIEHLVEVHKIDEIYLMAALLSATAEKTLLSPGI
jgi:hypothetical protein